MGKLRLQLNDAQKRAIIMLSKEGLSASEIANRLSRSNLNMKNLFHPRSIKKNLKKYRENDQFDRKKVQIGPEYSAAALEGCC